MTPPKKKKKRKKKIRERKKNAGLILTLKMLARNLS